MSKLKYSMHLKGDLGKITIIISILFLLFLVTGLDDYIGARDDIENSYIITTAGIDRGQSDDAVRLTIISKKSGGDKDTTEDKRQKYFSAEATSIFELNRKFHTFMNQDIFWGHLDVILMSQAIAEKDLPTHIHFFIADHETRLDSLLFIVKGQRAEEVIKLVAESDNDVTDLLNNLNRGVGANSISSEVDLLKASNLIIHQYNAPYVPLLKMQEDLTYVEDATESNQNITDISDANLQEKKTDDQTRKEASKSQIALVGYAFFHSKTCELVGFLEDYDARGFNWVTDNISSGTITVKDSEGANVVLEIINSKPKVEAKMKGNSIDVTLSVTMYSNIVEEQGSVDSTNKEGLTNLNNQQKQAIENEIQAAVNFATQHDLDIFDVGNVIFHKYPKKWDEIKDNWQEKVSTINYTIEVDSSIKRVYMFDSPLASKSDEEK